MVVIKKDKPLFAGFRADRVDLLQNFVKALVARTHAFAEIRNGNVLYADGLVIVKNLFKRFAAVHQFRNVRRNRNKTDLVKDLFYFGGSDSVKAGKLDAVITDVLDLLHRAAEILCRFLTNRIDLNGYG